MDINRLPQAWKLVGETIREAGILVAVFAPLDALMHEEPRPPTRTVAILIAAGLISIACGIILEIQMDRHDEEPKA